jgi:hypothetical protein
MHTNAPRTETKRGSRMLNRNAMTLDLAPARTAAPNPLLTPKPCENLAEMSKVSNNELL